MAMTLNPATSESYITASSFKVAPFIGNIPSTTFRFAASDLSTPAGVVYSKWTQILTGSGFKQPVEGTPVFEGGGGGTPRPSTGIMWPRGT